MAYVREKMSSMPLKDLIGELKSYNQPPEVVTQVMQGVLLLVGRVKSVKDAPEWRKGVHQQMNDPLVKECLALDASAQGRNKAWLESKKATKSLTSDEVLKRGGATKVDEWYPEKRLNDLIAKVDAKAAAAANWG